jgi:hypothetical protein
MGGRLPVAVHRCDDAATHVAVKQNGAELAIGGNTPEGLDPTGIDFFVCDAFGLFRRDVHRLDDIPNGRQIEIGIRQSPAHSGAELRELSRFIACHGVTFRFCTGRSGRRRKWLRQNGAGVSAMEQRFHEIAVRSAWGSASTDSGAAKADCRRSSYSTPYRPPQALQHLRHQQRELALVDAITAPTTVYEAMTPFDGDGPIDPTVRRIRRTPPRAEGSPAPPHVYRQQLYLHPEEMQVDHSYTWTRSNEGTEVTVSATRSRESAAAAIRIAHVGPPRGLVACSVELLCLAFIPIPFPARLALRRTPQRRVSGLHGVGAAAGGRWRTCR